jgi:hypothetical protein
MRPAITVALVLALVTCSQSQPPPPTFELAAADSIIFVCVADPELTDKIRRILHEGLDEALKDAVTRTFEVWMKDPTDQPRRAAQGVRNAVSAYIQSRDKLDLWQPQPCAREAP